MRIASLSALSVRSAADRPGRSVLVAAGVALGVALFTGALLTSLSTNRAIDRFIDEAGGQADVMAVPPGGLLGSLLDPSGTTLPATVAGDVAALPEVDSVEGVVGFGTSLSVPGGPSTEPELNRGPPVAVVGTGLASGSLLPVEAGAGRLPMPGADEIAVTGDVADDLRLAPGERVLVDTPTGARPVVVSAVLDRVGIGRLDGVAVTSTETARRFTGITDRFSQVAVRLADGVDVDAWTDRHGDALGGGTRLQPASRGLDLYRDQLQLLSGALTASAAGVLGVGGFLVYLTMSLNVVERTRLYGTLQALGATRRQVRRLVAAEAAVLAGVATPVGVLLGVGLAHVLSAAGRRLVFEGGASSGVGIEPAVLVAGALMGVAVTTASAFVPAHRAARLDAVAAMRQDHAADQRLSPAWVAGAVLAVAGFAGLVTGSSPQRLMPALLMVLVGAVLLVPPVLRPLARALGWVTGRLSPGSGRVAVLHLAKERTRSAYTLALVMLVMTLGLAMGSVWSSFTTSLDRQIEQTYGDSVGLLAATAVPAELLAALEAHPAVAAVSAVGEASTERIGEGGRGPVLVRAVDPARHLEVSDLPIVGGDRQAMIDALSRGGAVVVPVGSAERLGLRVGNALRLQTTAGPRDFTVVGIVEFSNNPMTVHVGAADGRDLFGIEGSRNLQLAPADGWAPEEVAAAVEADLGDRASFLTYTTEDRKADTRAQVGAGINGFFVLVALAAVVGAFGLANTLAVSVAQRSREIGLLQAIGARRRQVQAMAVIEAMTLVAVAFVLAVPLGSALSGPMLRGVSAGIGDLHVDHVFPWQSLPIMAVAGLAIAAAAAAWPARRAAALDVDAALRFE